MQKCCEAGVDILEVGFPAKDPSFDGEVIRAAQEQVDKALAADVGYWRELRNAVDVPIWLMGYRADLMQEGIYLTLAREGLYDALVIPDITEAERQRLAAILDPYRVSVLGFINPVQSNAEIEAVATTADLIYHQLYCGPTGVAHDDDGYLSVFNRARELSQAKLYEGKRAGAVCTYPLFPDFLQGLCDRAPDGRMRIRPDRMLHCLRDGSTHEAMERTHPQSSRTGGQPSAAPVRITRVCRRGDRSGS